MMVRNHAWIPTEYIPNKSIQKCSVNFIIEHLLTERDKASQKMSRNIPLRIRVKLGSCRMGTSGFLVVLSYAIALMYTRYI
jgi:hypothetical protein